MNIFLWIFLLHLGCIQIGWSCSIFLLFFPINKFLTLFWYTAWKRFLKNNILANHHVRLNTWYLGFRDTLLQIWKKYNRVLPQEIESIRLIFWAESLFCLLLLCVRLPQFQTTNSKEREKTCAPNRAKSLELKTTSRFHCVLELADLIFLFVKWILSAYTVHPSKLRDA